MRVERRVGESAAARYRRAVRAGACSIAASRNTSRLGFAQCREGHDDEWWVPGLPPLAREAIADLRAHLTYLDERINRYERQLVSLAKAHEPARRVQGVPGVGPLTASAITASIATGHEFVNGRQFAAWLGLVPRQYSTGVVKPNWGVSPNAATRTCAPC
jgi:transposase